MLKGILGLLLLAQLNRGDDYGYSIVSALRDVGFTELAEGTVYPALTRLENAGDLTSYLSHSTCGPARKYYRVTEQGHRALAERQAAWQHLTTAVSAALTREG
jgi:PadR family transcriptional regulator PadR